jgi:hypothetical protein
VGVVVVLKLVDAGAVVVGVGVVVGVTVVDVKLVGVGVVDVRPDGTTDEHGAGS